MNILAPLKTDIIKKVEDKFDRTLNNQICIMRDNVIKRAAMLGMNNPRQLWLKTHSMDLDIASSYVSRLWNYNPKESEKDTKKPNFSISKVLVLALALECSLSEILNGDSNVEINSFKRLTFSGGFYDRMVQACSDTMSRLVAMERIAILKPLKSQDIIDLQFSSFNQSK